MKLDTIQRISEQLVLGRDSCLFLELEIKTTGSIRYDGEIRRHRIGRKCEKAKM